MFTWQLRTTAISPLNGKPIEQSDRVAYKNITEFET